MERQFPSPSCSATRTASLFYIRASASGRKTKLDAHLNAAKKNGWDRGRMVHSYGVELHTLFEKRKAYLANGRPPKRPKFLTKPDDFDPPTMYCSSNCL